jgi:hypothetical protein
VSLQHAEGWTRRCFPGGLTLVGTTGLLGLHSKRAAAGPPSETTRIRLAPSNPPLMWKCAPPDGRQGRAALGHLWTRVAGHKACQLVIPPS